MNFTLETNRLLLRPLEHTDALGMFELDSNPNVMRYLGGKTVESVADSEQIIRMIQKQYTDNGIGRYAIILKETGEFIGWAGLKFITETENNHINYYDIGYRLAEAHWGKGYGYEAAKAWLDHGFNTMKIPAVYASAHIENTGSNKILQKIGLHQREQYLHHNLPCYWYELKNPTDNSQLTSKMTTLKIAGVPEHFNLPWHLCLENNEFKSEQINLQWTDIPEGTGKLCQMLRSGETDIAVILTEGIVKDIVAGNPSKIVQVYVESPLIWGIHVATDSNYNAIEDLKNTKAAISRLGSGSQLMAYVNAHNQGWPTESLQFEIVNTIDGAVEALTNKTADYFMWERFMTKPFVDKGIFRRVDDCPTPWPCFVIAVRDEILQQHPEQIKKLLQIINAKTSEFKAIPNIDSTLATRYHQKTEDIREWLSLTQWSQKPLSEEVLNKVQNQLFELALIDKKGTFAEIVEAV